MPPPAKGRGGEGEAAGAQPSWKKPQGGALSAKAKKEYLKWKRAQKRDKEDDDGSGSDGSDVGGAARGSVGAKPAQRGAAAGAQRPDRPAGPAAGAGGGGVDAGAPPQQRAQPLGAAQGRAVAPDDAPLRYAPMEALPPGDVPAYIKAVCDVSCVRMARVREEEVGFSEQGRQLGMPMRPDWKGVIRNASELHGLEEAAFKKWVDSLYAQADSSRISFFEPRLDYWRQLWRVLERSDVAIMICDARNPLLHFSEALVHHMLHTYHMSALLVLNKCDLVPKAAAEEWRRFFEGRYPGLQVVLSSASKEGGGDAAERILDALLACRVRRGREELQVSEIVQLPRDTILHMSRTRNTHSKRDRPQPPPAAGRAGGSGAAAVAAAAGQDVGDDEEGEEDGGGGDWNLRGTKAKKKVAVRKKRQQRMNADGGGAAAHYHDSDDDDGPCCSAPARGATAAGRGRPVPGGGTRGSHNGGGRHGGRQSGRGGGDLGSTTAHSGSGAEEGSGEEDEEEGQEERAADDLGSDEEEARSVDEGENDNDAFEGLGSGEEDEEAADDDDDGQVAVGAAQQQRPTGQPARQQGGRQQGAARRGNRGLDRPVVVCVVGEPNVGKSSTMNALLGAHRVAVSSHPGRTKHYQTHFMVDKLMLCDCPGLVFPRLDVSLPMQILYGSYPIARCRDPYGVVRYLAERVWPRLHVTMALSRVVDKDDDDASKLRARSGTECAAAGVDGGGSGSDGLWTPMALCESLAAKLSWRSKRGGRLDIYRAANWILRSALAGRNGINLAFLPPEGWEERLAARPGGAPAAL